VYVDEHVRRDKHIEQTVEILYTSFSFSSG